MKKPELPEGYKLLEEDEEDIITKPIDRPSLLYRHIERILVLSYQDDPIPFINSVTMLEHFLSSEIDEAYKNNIASAENTRLKMLKKVPDWDTSGKNYVNFTYTGWKFRYLQEVMTRRGLLP